MTTDLVPYTPLDLDDLENQEKELGFNQGGGTYYKFKDGRNIIRILPGKPGSRAIVGLWKHFVKGAEGGKAWGGACPNKMAKLTCPCCQVAAKLSRGSEADRKLSKDITARQKSLANIIDRSNPDAGPQLVEFGPQIYNSVKDMLKMGDDPTNPGADGFDLVVEKTGSGLNTEYKCMAVRKSSPLHPDPKQAAEWLNDAMDLSQLVTIQAEHEISNRLGGTIVSHMLGSKAAATRPAGRKVSNEDVIDVDADPDADINY